MRVLNALACAGLVAGTGCFASMAASRRAAQVAAVTGVIDAFSTALERGDTAQVRILAGPGFRLLEDSVEYDLARASTAVAGVLTSGKLSRALTEIRIATRGSVAWATYRVNAVFVSGGESLRFARWESAVLERTDGRWRLVFMTSMPAGSP
jgi:ketosteroid isomerase-like protein